MPMEVGDVFVYRSHGIGRVECRGTDGGSLSETITLSFESGLRVTLPVPHACEALRPLASELELDVVQRTLHTQSLPTTEPWSRRFRASREKVSSGEVIELAEVVRDGLQRERRLAASAKGGHSAMSDRQLYLQARKLLAAEIASCRGVDIDDADAWIAEQVREPDTISPR